jgi:C-terminal processing protease CtpA/Prc
MFNTLALMLNELRDGHVNLISPFNISIYPVHQLGPENISKRLIEDHYLSKPFFITGPFVHSFIDSGRVGYIQFSSFTGTVTPEQMDYMLEKYQNTRGLILDLRGNGGGAATDIYKIMGRFVESKTKIFRTKDKSGPGANDFSAGLDSYLEPYKGRRYTKKLAVLCDRGSYSAGSYTSLATKALDNVLLIGDTTGGGLGMPNGGQLPNGWTYRFSVTQTLDLQGNNYEDGVPPDVRVILDAADVAKGKDSVIEKALEELKK